MTVTGGSVEEQAALRESLSGLPRAPIESATISKPPSGFSPAGDNWVSVDVRVADNHDASEAHWHALMLVGAFRAKSIARQLTPVLGKTINVRLSDGTLFESAGSVIDRPIEQPISAQADSATRGIVDAAAGGAGLSVRSVDFVRSGGNGIVVCLVAQERSSVGEWRTRFLSNVKNRLVPPGQERLEGTLFKVYDDAGDLVAVSGYSVLTGEGVGWTDPKYDAARFPFIHPKSGRVSGPPRDER